MPKDEDFSLVEGGPLYRLLCRCGLIRPPMLRTGRRMMAMILLAWLPLFGLAAVGGHLLGGVQVPFLEHLDVHARLLGSLPLLLLAEVIVHQRITIIVRQFVAQGLIPPESRARFDAILESTRRMARWWAPELLLMVFVYTVGHWLWIRRVALPVETWFGYQTPTGLSLTPAGFWYAFFSLPLFRFVLYRWYYRLALWYRLLWKVSRLPLNLNPAHPDGAAGLGFLGESTIAFSPILVAHTISVSGLIGDRILHRGASLPGFRIEIGLVLIGLLLLVLIPLFFFTLHLARIRRRGLREHSLFAARYVEDFDRKWIHPPAPSTESALGSPDIQTLSDLENHFRTMLDMRTIPVGKKTVIKVAILLVLPLLPLALTVMPLEEILTRLAKFVV
jgi:hypothetical protein